jgi:DNA modification methylase
MGATFFENRVGDALDFGRQLKRDGLLIDAVVTSPPYFGVRDYGGADRDTAEVGRETDDEIYIERIADALAALPVRETGSIWVNIGDVRRRPGDGSLRRIPDRFAAAMARRRWITADRVSWTKGSVDENGSTWGNPMPESIGWRLNDNSKEDLFRFVRSKRAWVDLCAVGVPRAGTDISKTVPYLPHYLMKTRTDIQGRRRMDTWRIQVSKSPVQHYAMFPAALVEVPIAMTCPMWVCQTCGHARRRLTRTVEIEGARVEMRTLGKYRNADDRDASAVGFRRPTRNRPGTGYRPTMPVTVGWTDCGHDNYAGGIVLDPFAGTGTSGEVALKLGRSYIGNDLYADAASFAETRLREVAAWMAENELDPWELAQ